MMIIYVLYYEPEPIETPMPFTETIGLSEFTDTLKALLALM